MPLRSAGPASKRFARYVACWRSSPPAQPETGPEPTPSSTGSPAGVPYGLDHRRAPDHLGLRCPSPPEAAGPALKVLDAGSHLDLLVHSGQAATLRLAQPVMLFAFAEEVLQAGALALRRGTPSSPYGQPRRVAGKGSGQLCFPLPL